MTKKIAFNPIYLPQNRGLGNALREALSKCTYDLVARMDSDDISAPYRFEKQVKAFIDNPTLDIVGGAITEFVGEPDNITGKRTVELSDEEIKSDMKKRCGMNHVSVMYKKSSVQDAGGYQDWYYNEDYFLWVRMLEQGCKFGNVPYPLVNVRTGADMSARRGGWKYFRSEQLLQKYMLNHRIITLPRYIYNVVLRFGGEFLATNFVRQWIFKMIREEYKPEPLSKIKTEVVDIDDLPPFSVAISVYKNDNPDWFDSALESIIVKQTVKPAEVVLVVDGPVTEGIQKIINKYMAICSMGTIT